MMQKKPKNQTSITRESIYEWREKRIGELQRRQERREEGGRSKGRGETGDGRRREGMQGIGGRRTEREAPFKVPAT
jgi:hypothetical protein